MRVSRGSGELVFERAKDSSLGGDHEHDAQLRGEDDCRAQAGDGWAEGALGRVKHASVAEAIGGYEHATAGLLTGSRLVRQDRRKGVRVTYI